MLTFSPAVTAATFILFSLLYMRPHEVPGSYSPNGYISGSPGWGYYIALPLIIAVTIMSIPIALGKVKNASQKTVHTSVATDVPSEITKYKALLDEGVITQEEFDSKKKQLLEM